MNIEIDVILVIQNIEKVILLNILVPILVNILVP